MAFNPDQPRDEHGRWGASGAADAASSKANDVTSHRRAYRAHLAAAVAHTQAGDHAQAKIHSDKAKSHRAAVKKIKGNAETPKPKTEAPKPVAPKPATAHVFKAPEGKSESGMTLSKPLPVAMTPSKSMDPGKAGESAQVGEANSAAINASLKARQVSEKASNSSPESHRDAAIAHEKAAQAHAKAGNTHQAKAHEHQAQVHERAADAFDEAVQEGDHEDAYYKAKNEYASRLDKEDWSAARAKDEAARTPSTKSAQEAKEATAEAATKRAKKLDDLAGKLGTKQTHADARSAHLEAAAAHIAANNPGEAAVHQTRADYHHASSFSAKDGDPHVVATPAKKPWDATEDARQADRNSFKSKSPEDYKKSIEAHAAAAAAHAAAGNFAQAKLHEEYVKSTQQALQNATAPAPASKPFVPVEQRSPEEQVAHWTAKVAQHKNDINQLTGTGLKNQLARSGARRRLAAAKIALVAARKLAGHGSGAKGLLDKVDAMKGQS